MALDTYADLQSAIILYAFRQGDTEFAATCPTFIALCEARVNNILRVRDMEDSAAISMTDGEGTLPADYLQYREVIANAPGRSYPLSAADPGVGQENYPDAGFPACFAVKGNKIRTYPKSTVDLTLNYFAKIPALSDSEPTNWLLEKSPGVYLYGSLLEAAPFMMDDGRISTWAQLHEGALTLLRQEDEMAKYAGAKARVRGVTP
jgi:hypothetical protein